jgi:hypothetical protein
MSDVRAAIETALNGMAPLLAAAAISTSSVATSTVILTTAPHGLATGLYVKIAAHLGSTPSINGIFPVTVLTTTTFSIPVTVTIGGTGGTVTAQLSAWENVDFAPITGIPYQSGTLVPAKPDNIEIGPMYREQGFYQVDLAYPEQVGAKAPEARAALVRSTFKRGNTFSSNGVTVTIMGTPQVLQGYPSPGCWVVPVRIPYQAWITA